MTWLGTPDYVIISLTQQ